MRETLQVGELVRPQPGRMGGLTDAVGLVTQIQRNRACVWFPDRFEKAWLSLRDLVRLRWTGDPRQHRWVLVSWLILQCRGQAFEWSEGPPALLSVLTDSVQRVDIETITAFLGSIVTDWSVRPASLSTLWIDWTLHLNAIPV